MATIPIVDSKDKRIGIISAIFMLLLTLLFLFLLNYELPDPLPTFKKVVTATELDEEIVLKDLKVEGGAGGGTPSNSETTEPQPIKQQAITNNSKPSKTQTTTGGQATSTNSNNTTNTSSGGQQSSNPFGDGGSGGGQGGGSGPGFGEDKGEGTGSGNGIGFGSKNRKRLNNPDVHNISIETDASIYYKLTVDSKGNVVAFSHIASSTTTTNLNLINKIGVAIKKQVKYSEAPGAPLEYQFYTIHVKAT